MSVVSFNKLDKSYTHFDVFSGLSGGVPKGASIGLVGPNGIGKTTLLRLIAGLERPTDGVLHVAKGTKIGYLQQEAVQAFEDHKNSVFEEMLTVFSELRREEARIRKMETNMASGASDELLGKYGAAQEAFEAGGGYDYELNIKKVLDGLGFNSSQWNMPLEHCSGGQKTRALLARLLLEQPDLLILDEPTNHLDTLATEWLEMMLKLWKGSLLIVSHDRYFLDNTVNIVWEMNASGLEIYRGNYSAYLQQREARWERRGKEFGQVKEMFLKELDFIKRNIDAATDQAKGRMKRLVRQVKAVEIAGASVVNQKWSEFMKESGGISRQKWNVPALEKHIRDLVYPNPSIRKISMEFSSTKHIAEKVIRANNLTVGYPGNALFQAHEIEVGRGSRIALTGPNGSGKSTFLRLLVEELTPLSGDFRLGAALKIGYYAQTHDLLNRSNSVIDEIRAHDPGMQPPQARHYLARFLFHRDDVFKQVGDLSGGERGRLILAIMSLEKVNLLVLDEPTNHLDIQSQEVLEEALRKFEGTTILVTHDRYLIERVATEVWEIHNELLTVYKGNYSEYKRAKLEQSEKTVIEKTAKIPVRTRKPRTRKINPQEAAQEISRTEDRIHQIEEELPQLAGALDSAVRSSESKKIRELNDAYASLEQELKTLLSRWEELSMSLSG